jgi:hypothetical protein
MGAEDAAVVPVDAEGARGSLAIRAGVEKEDGREASVRSGYVMLELSIWSERMLRAADILSYGC